VREGNCSGFDQLGRLGRKLESGASEPTQTAPSEAWSETSR
jgi:hypothetical protein